MTKHEKFMNKSDYLCLRAIDFATSGKWLVAKIYKMLSNNFKSKARNLKSGE